MPRLGNKELTTDYLKRVKTKSWTRPRTVVAVAGGTLGYGAARITESKQTTTENHEPPPTEIDLSKIAKLSPKERDTVIGLLKKVGYSVEGTKVDLSAILEVVALSDKYTIENHEKALNKAGFYIARVDQAKWKIVHNSTTVV